MDTATLLKMIETAYDNQAKARTELMSWTTETMIDRDEYERAKSEALRSGKIDGKNEEIRKAQLADLLAGPASELSTTEREENRARGRYDLASIEVERVRTILRVYELPPSVDELARMKAEVAMLTEGLRMAEAATTKAEDEAQRLRDELAAASDIAPAA